MNPYVIILVLVLLGGIAITGWGWRVMRQAQQKKQWPTTEGTITECEPVSKDDDLLPHIVFNYQVAGTHYSRPFQFPDDTNPLPEFAQAYVKKYPVGKTVQVFYHPEQPQEATLEPATRGDWMILAIGVLMLLGGAAALTNQ
ncbi:MAG TPA: DUF3592 domain-containing protein [Candidatus Tenderia sp.]|nr:DUF3592 domain-containing protein [Candidatus Tenderia sp.]